MILTLFKKELLQNILSPKYLVTFLLFFFLIGSATILRGHLYVKQAIDFQEAQKNREKLLASAEKHWQSRGLGMTVEKPPNPLSIFALGLENEMVRSFSLSDWFPPTTGPRKFAIPAFRYFSSLDLVNIIALVCSLLALLLVYDSVSGERESGTLKVLLAGPLPKDSIILGKILAGLTTLLVPMFLSLLVALFYVTVILKVQYDSSQLISLFVLFILSAIYITFFFALGTAVSTFSRNSSTSLVICLFCWTILVLGIPNAAPMMMRHFAPIPPQSKIILEKQAEREEVEKVLEPKWRAEMSESGEYTSISEIGQEIHRRVEKEVSRREAKIDRFHNNRIQKQLNLSQNFSRLSPTSGYIYASTEIAGTGAGNFLDLLEEVDAFQQRALKVLEELEKKRKEEEKRLKKEKKYTREINDAYDYREYPVFNPENPGISHALSKALIDVAIICCLTVVLLLTGIIGFMKQEPN